MLTLPESQSMKINEADHNEQHPALDVVVVGEALVDVVASPSGPVEHPGGSPANVAYGLGLLGVRTGLLTALGPDARGAAIENHLQSAGVTLLAGSRSLHRTSSATVKLANDGSAEYGFDITWELSGAAPDPLPRLLHTGSIATFLAPGAGAVKTLVEQARPHCTITYDPNIRPDLLGSQAEAKDTFEDLVASTDLVKLSDEDARWLYPFKSHEETAAHILGLGAKLAVVTMGAGGAHLSSGEATVNVAAIKTPVADTIGAGDSFMSALILGFLARATADLDAPTLVRMGQMAAAAAAITVSRSGANPPSLEELEAVFCPAQRPDSSSGADTTIGTKAAATTQ